MLLVKKLPSISVRIASEKYNVAVDTGSEVTLFRSDVHKLIPNNLQKWSPTTQMLYGLGDKVTNTSREAIVFATVGEAEYEVRFDIVPDAALEVPMLLGMNFLRSVDFVITNTGVTVQRKKGR